VGEGDEIVFDGMDVNRVVDTMEVLVTWKIPKL
jgi:hypothetical protein